MDRRVILHGMGSDEVIDQSGIVRGSKCLDGVNTDVGVTVIEEHDGRRRAGRGFGWRDNRRLSPPGLDTGLLPRRLCATDHRGSSPILLSAVAKDWQAPGAWPRKSLLAVPANPPLGRVACLGVGDARIKHQLPSRCPTERPSRHPVALGPWDRGGQVRVILPE